MSKSRKRVYICLVLVWGCALVVGLPIILGLNGSTPERYCMIKWIFGRPWAMSSDLTFCHHFDPAWMALAAILFATHCQIIWWLFGNFWKELKNCIWLHKLLIVYILVVCIFYDVDIFSFWIICLWYKYCGLQDTYNFTIFSVFIW